jgi:hypothetical protein
MLEIIALVYLGKEIKKIVEAKGLKATKYIVIMITLWVGLELTGAIVGTLVAGEQQLTMYLFAITGAAFGGYLSYRVAVNAEPAILDRNGLFESNDILDSDL